MFEKYRVIATEFYFYPQIKTKFGWETVELKDYKPGYFTWTQDRWFRAEARCDCMRDALKILLDYFKYKGRTVTFEVVAKFKTIEQLEKALNELE